jgi:hypothetical protein
MGHFSFYPVGDDGFLLVGLVALVLLALLALGPGRAKASAPRRATLFVLRLGVVLLVLLAMLRPTLVYFTMTKQPATLVIMLDKSRSMTVTDEVGGRSRWEAERRTLADARSALAKLGKDIEVKAYTFDGELHPVDVVGGQLQVESQPDGQQTAIGAAIEDVMRENAGKRLLGVVLLSDGAQQARPPRDEAPETAAAQMKYLGPIFTIRFGKSRGLGQRQDVAVTSLTADQRVFVKNELTVSAQVRIDGYVNREIPVQLWFETSPGKMQVVAQKSVTATVSGQILPVEFLYVPTVPGEYKLAVEVPKQPDEQEINNNRLSTFVNVQPGGLKALYVEGAPRIEAHFLRRSLDASRDIHVDFVRLDPRQPEVRPADFGDRFKPGKYDVYLLGDVDSTAFRGSELADLAAVVQRGAGLIMLGGYQSFGPGGYDATPLAPLLPVEMSRFARQQPDEPIRVEEHWPGPLKMKPTEVGLLHFSLMLADSRTASLAIWNRLQPLEGANKLSKKVSALELAASGEKPLLLSQTYRNGRVMAFAGDSTWHWCMEGYEAAHKRFWRQVVLWLARKDDSLQGNVWVKLSERRCMPGQKMEATVGAQTPSGDPLPDALFQTTLIFPDGGKRAVRMVRSEDRTSGRILEIGSPGDYTVEVTATRDGKTLGTAKTRFTVLEQDLELDDSAAVPGMMDGLAAMTGGQSLAPEDLPRLIQRLTKDTESLAVRTESKQTLWDTWTFFVLLVGLLGTEWYLRKRWGLV